MKKKYEHPLFEVEFLDILDLVCGNSYEDAVGGAGDSVDPGEGDEGEFDWG